MPTFVRVGVAVVVREEFVLPFVLVAVIFIFVNFVFCADYDQNIGSFSLFRCFQACPVSITGNPDGTCGVFLLLLFFFFVCSLLVD